MNRERIEIDGPRLFDRFFSIMEHHISMSMAAWSLRDASYGEKDEFGRQKAKRPLLLHQVTRDRVSPSSAHLFQLADEILSDIMELIGDDNATLSALALVSRDCWQLARSCQFVDVCFDYGPRSTELLHHLRSEGRAQTAKSSSAAVRPLMIGPCIRRVTVKPKSYYVASAHQDLHECKHGPGSHLTSNEELPQLEQEALDIWVENFHVPLLDALAQSMPHLEALVWSSAFCLDNESFKAIASLPIPHLKFEYANIRVPCRVEPPMVPLPLPLRSLVLNVDFCKRCPTSAAPDEDAKAIHDGEYDKFMSTFAQRCSGTLERLTIVDFPYYFIKRHFTDHELLDFPRLTHLDLSEASDIDPAAMSSLMASPLTHLALAPGSLTNFEKFAHQYPICRDLKTLVMPVYKAKLRAETAESISEFIAQHRHVSKLAVHIGTASFMDRHLDPFLLGQWSNLTSLSLAWQGPDRLGEEPYSHSDLVYLNAYCLEAVGNLSSLEQLCLGASSTDSRSWKWAINHDTLRSKLRNLEKLKKMAICNDVYSSHPRHDAQSYYVTRYLAVEEQDAAKQYFRDHPAVAKAFGEESNGRQPRREEFYWELMHRDRMIKEAVQYKEMFPQLSWMYFGQLPMSIETKQTPQGPICSVTPLSKERDLCKTLLKRMFEVDDEI